MHMNKMFINIKNILWFGYNENSNSTDIEFKGRFMSIEGDHTNIIIESIKGKEDWVLIYG